ncbi:MAG: oligoribonuclease, partial [Gordonia sp. (in: high G+C Gram-positive bacteria)]
AVMAPSPGPTSDEAQAIARVVAEAQA